MNLLPGESAGNVVVISPHPDDESIGCGGTIRRHVMAGDKVTLLFLTSGEGGGHGRPASETGPLREQEATTAGTLLGVAHIDFWRLPDGKVRSDQTLVFRLAEYLKSIDARAVFVTHEAEAHPDHRAAARLVRRAAGELIEQRIEPPALWGYEVWTPMQEFEYVVDISEQLTVKLEAVRAHKSQCAVMRFDESAQGLARYRGEMHSWPGGDYAEVFQEPPPIRARRAAQGRSVGRQAGGRK
ncbi:PIG-L deacetylase family protein [Humisphaera borealis]|uniref:PIG-L family deacetylase n=1 Tax=Humisphaera borealis TaxID=2807512 RepID=A0A7M2WXG7_9BACT|nr:PIG-L family deacetylase [Humisphaera borealis]QOV90176.1 PIG-L family deacetylase [Humisphaera borealis]